MVLTRHNFCATDKRKTLALPCSTDVAILKNAMPFYTLSFKKTEQVSMEVESNKRRGPKEKSV